MRGLPRILSLFRNEFNKVDNTLSSKEARDSKIAKKWPESS